MSCCKAESDLDTSTHDDVCAPLYTFIAADSVKHVYSKVDCVTQGFHLTWNAAELVAASHSLQCLHSDLITLHNSVILDLYVAQTLGNGGSYNHLVTCM